ncbi:DUF397 domain-containing protein [Streptomyces sp. NBC_00708]
MAAYEFVKSSYSGGNAGQECVEVALNVPGSVAVRDSKVSLSAVLVVAPATWDAFTHGMCKSSAMDTRS